MTKTVKCKLILSKDQSLALTETMVTFASACNEIAAYRDRLSLFHRWALSAYYYRYVRHAYGLTANYCVRIFDRVAANRTAKTFSPGSIPFDKDLFRFIEPSEEATISTMRGRIRARLDLGDYQRQLLKGWRVGAGTINYDRRTNQFFANLCVDIQEPPAAGSKPLGVDLGINRIAVTSTGRVFSGREVIRKREKFHRVRHSLMLRGTKGAKRVLKRLAGRESRFQRDVNHNISKRIVTLAKETDSFIALENLKGIRERTAKHGKHHRRRIGRWAFYQLRQYLSYKAQEAGVRLVLVDPRNTSKTCSACGSIGVRRKHRFSCCSCGFVGDADVQAAINIAAKGLFTNRPEVARYFER